MIKMINHILTIWLTMHHTEQHELNNGADDIRGDTIGDLCLWMCVDCTSNGEPKWQTKHIYASIPFLPFCSVSFKRILQIGRKCWTKCFKDIYPNRLRIGAETFVANIMFFVFPVRAYIRTHRTRVNPRHAAYKCWKHTF